MGPETEPEVPALGAPRVEPVGIDESAGVAVGRGEQEDGRRAASQPPSADVDVIQEHPRAGADRAPEPHAFVEHGLGVAGMVPDVVEKLRRLQNLPHRGGQPRRQRLQPVDEQHQDERDQLVVGELAVTGGESEPAEQVGSGLMFAVGAQPIDVVEKIVDLSIGVRGLLDTEAEHLSTEHDGPLQDTAAVLDRDGEQRAGEGYRQRHGQVRDDVERSLAGVRVDQRVHGFADQRARLRDAAGTEGADREPLEPAMVRAVAQRQHPGQCRGQYGIR